MKTIYAPMNLSGILYADQCLSLKRHDSLYVLSSLLLWLVAMCDGKLNFSLKSLILDNSVLGGYGKVIRPVEHQGYPLELDVILYFFMPVIDWLYFCFKMHFLYNTVLLPHSIGCFRTVLK